MNVLTGIVIFMMVTQRKVFLETWLVVGSIAIFQVTTYIRYIYKDDHSISVIEHTWLNKTEAYRNLTHKLLIIYGAGSVLLFIGLALYLGIRR